MEKTLSVIGIGGGVGPAAANELARLVEENTDKLGLGDAGQIPVILFNHAVPDRTKFLLGEETQNPGLIMSRIVAGIERAALEIDPQYRIVTGVPCNTFHAPSIWECFEESVTKNTTRTRLVHMLQETVAHIRQIFPNENQIGLLSTTGTRQVRVYHDLLEAAGYKVIEVPMEEQHGVHELIYHPEWGIKAKSPPSDQARANMYKYTRMIQDQGANILIEGCTELPLARAKISGITYVNPMEILARALIREAAPEKLLN